MCLALLALGLLGAAGALLSDLPLAGRVPLALGACAYAALLAWRECQRPSCTLEFAEGVASMQGLNLAATRLQLRGPLACLSWRAADGRRGSLLWWADTLPPASRRQLLLCLGGPSPA